MNQKRSQPEKRSSAPQESASWQPAPWREHGNLLLGIILLAGGVIGMIFMHGEGVSTVLIILGTLMVAWELTSGASGSGRSKTKRSAGKGSAGSKRNGARDGTRETVESVVIAFILAFLFRTFEAEAFVIPTGSMAPTLYGRHKDVSCKECGFHFVIGASDELDSEFRGPAGGGRWIGGLLSAGPLAKRLSRAFCPNCRYENDVYNLPVFKGDRILVNKHDIEPKRFDVIVFKYPEEPRINYIKRLVGLPGETILIRQGDLWARRSDMEPWRIVRKDDPGKQRPLQLTVHDDQLPARALLEAGWPERWASVEQHGDGAAAIAGWSETSSGWIADREARTFRIDGSGGADRELRWFRYRHFVAQPSDWESVTAGFAATEPHARLISDFCHYNAYTIKNRGERGMHTGRYWVGDLTLNCTIEIENADDDGEIVVELVEGLRWNRCRINPATGVATLLYVDRLIDRTDVIEHVMADAETSIHGAGTWDVTFANVDDRLCLWIDGRLVDFGAGAGEYAADRPEPTQLDLTPLGIAARGVTAVVSRLRIERDVYYRANVAHPVRPDSHSRLDTITEIGAIEHEDTLGALLDTPAAWYEYYSTGLREKAEDYRNHGNLDTYSLGEDEFLVLGDNSPRSKDSRLFGLAKRSQRLPEPATRHAVPRSALIGKAFFIYWPHGVPFFNDGKGISVGYHVDGQGNTVDDYPSFRVPFYPQIQRMERIR